MIIVLILAGLAGGVIGAMGMGGGTLLIPILTVFTSIPQKEAQCINLVSFGLIAAVSLFIHFKNKLVRFKQVWLLAAAAALSSAFFALFIKNAKSQVLQKCFGGFLLLLAAFQIFMLIKGRTKKNSKNTR